MRNQGNEKELSKEWWEYNLSREQSIVRETFCGQMKRKTYCSACDVDTIYNFDCFYDISVVLPENKVKRQTIKSLLDDFFATTEEFECLSAECPDKDQMMFR
jgi:ubiquitin C-terminal hydrolase